MSESSQLAEDVADLTMSESTQQEDITHDLRKLEIRTAGPAASQVDVFQQAADFKLGLSLALHETSTESESEDAKTAAYTAALDQIHKAKAEKAAKKRKKSSQRRPEASYKKARLREADGSGPVTRYRPSVHEKLEVLRFRYGDALTEGHTVRETLAKFANVTHAQLKKWKKQCDILSFVRSLCC